MQAACPQCAQKIVIDDSKVPERAFSVRCPKCQNVVKFPGRGSAAAPAPAPAAAPEAPAAEAPAAATSPAAAAPAASSSASPEELRAALSGLRRELGGADPRAVVVLPDRSQAATLSGAVAQLGYRVDTIDNPDEGGRLVEQGVYHLVVTTRTVAAQGRPETIYQRVNRLSPEGRRRLFMVLVGDEFKTGDAVQAYVTVADVVLNPRELLNCASLLASTLSERQRLYQVFQDARRAVEASPSAPGGHGGH